MLSVYPELKTYCQSRGFDFQVVDMRWGVRREVSADHITSELCMKEIKNCQKLSTGPNFIVSIPSFRVKILFIIFNLDQLVPCRYTEYILYIVHCLNACIHLVSHIVKVSNCSLVPS